MALMNLALPEALLMWVQSRVEHGDYATMSDYIGDLILKDQTRNQEQINWLAALDRSITDSLTSLAAGEGRPLEQVRADLVVRYARKAEAQS